MPMSMSILEEQEGDRDLVATKGRKTLLASTLLGLALAGSLLSSPGMADAAQGKRQIGDISASGLVFKVGAGNER